MIVKGHVIVPTLVACRVPIVLHAEKHGVWFKGRSVQARSHTPCFKEKIKMSRFLSTLEGAGGLDIIREVYIGTEKYLLFTRYAEAESQWQIG